MKRFFTVWVAAAILSPLPVISAVVGDINQDGKIDLIESVYALQVASGVYPTIDDSCLLTGQGSWMPGISYKLCDVIVVESSGITYACASPHVSATGVIEPTNTDYWTVLSIKGDKGDPGLTAAGQRCLGDAVVQGFDDSGNIICTKKQVFVTSEVFFGANLGGVAGADLKCQQAADQAGLEGSFKAWISTAQGTPNFDFTKSPVGYYLIDKTIVVDNWDEFGSSYGIKTPINIDENGNNVGSDIVWTNTLYDGTRNEVANDMTCSDFTVNTGDGLVGAWVGATDQTNSNWTTYYPFTCDSTARLYCFEQ